MPTVECGPRTPKDNKWVIIYTFRFNFFSGAHGLIGMGQVGIDHCKKHPPTGRPENFFPYVDFELPEHSFMKHLLSATNNQTLKAIQ